MNLCNSSLSLRRSRKSYRHPSRKIGRVEQLEARQLLAAAEIVDGYTDRWTYLPGETVELYLNGATEQTNVDLKIYDAALELRETIVVERLNPQQPAEIDPWKHGFGYVSEASYTIPQDMESGIYYFGFPKKLRDFRGGKQIPFIVKRPSKQSDIVYLTSTNTPNLYNESGGESAYTQYATDKTPTVSFERPRNTHFRTPHLNKWMALQDYDHRVISDREMDDYSELSGSKLLIVAGHNEYWSVKAHENLDRFVREGGSVLILGGNVLYHPVEYPTEDTIQVAGRTDWDAVLSSIGMNYCWGGRGNTCGKCDPSVGFRGYKVVDTTAPFFRGLELERGEILRIPYNSECDGFPNLGLDSDDATGFPIVDPEYSSDYYFFDLYGFEFAQMSWKPSPGRTLGGWIEFQHTPNSGRVLNVGATDWGNYGFTGPDGDDFKLLTENMVDYLLAADHVEPEIGDFDFNGVLDEADLDRLSAAVHSQQEPVWKYDLNADSHVSATDRQAWSDLAGLTWGDVNADAFFNSGDLISVFAAGEYEDGVPLNSTYNDGDWNGDRDFNSNDLIFVFQAGTFTANEVGVKARFGEVAAAVVGDTKREDATLESGDEAVHRSLFGSRQEKVFVLGQPIDRVFDDYQPSLSEDELSDALLALEDPLLKRLSLDVPGPLLM
ncbi:MAG: hypothetical protein P8N76_15175 [Pirellulaceae bacterium]|nr:hypothetical protein [Pirellulaceae bacterium]